MVETLWRLKFKKVLKPTNTSIRPGKRFKLG
jgi:hypothetical protein